MYRRKKHKHGVVIHTISGGGKRRGISKWNKEKLKKEKR